MGFQQDRIEKIEEYDARNVGVDSPALLPVSKNDASHQRDVNTLLPSLKGLVRIEHLNLARSNLTDKGLLEFAKNTNADIEILDTRWTRVTDSGLERFRERHPTTVFPLVGGKIDYPFLGVISENAEINDNVKVSQLMRQTASDKNH
ncbi:hypothetical protein [Gimesia fumaroli]|nr:hypothetical protein [Gimesia fumaroli]